MLLAFVILSAILLTYYLQLIVNLICWNLRFKALKDCAVDASCNITFRWTQNIFLLIPGFVWNILNLLFCWIAWWISWEDPWVIWLLASSNITSCSPSEEDERNLHWKIKHSSATYPDPTSIHGECPWHAECDKWHSFCSDKVWFCTV